MVLGRPPLERERARRLQLCCARCQADAPGNRGPSRGGLPLWLACWQDNSRPHSRIATRDTAHAQFQAMKSPRFKWNEATRAGGNQEGAPGRGTPLRLRRRLFGVRRRSTVRLGLRSGPLCPHPSYGTHEQRGERATSKTNIRMKYEQINCKKWRFN